MRTFGEKKNLNGFEVLWASTKDSIRLDYFLQRIYETSHNIFRKSRGNVTYLIRLFTIK